MSYYCSKCKTNHHSGKKFEEHKKFKSVKNKPIKSNPKTRVKKRSVMQQYKEQKILLEKIGKTITKPMSFLKKIKELEQKINELQKTNNALKNDRITRDIEEY